MEKLTPIERKVIEELDTELEFEATERVYLEMVMAGSWPGLPEKPRYEPS